AGLVVLALKPWSSAGAGLELFVATNGNDSATGEREAPFRTVERARDDIRRLKSVGQLPRDGVTVTVRGGTYELSRPLEFASHDGGTPERPIVYRSEPGAEVRVTGGRIVAAWRLVTEPEILHRLNKEARGKVWASDLRAQGITNFGMLKARSIVGSLRS